MQLDASDKEIDVRNVLQAVHVPTLILRVSARARR